MSLIPFIIINGFLTGSYTSEPIVWYNDAHNLGLRFLNIPIETSFIQVITATLGIIMTILKAYLLVFIAILLRWTTPRVRIDQLLDLGWKFLLPISLANLLLTAGLKLALPNFFGG